MRRALLLIDVINDFMDPGGVNYHVEYEETLTSIKKTLDMARRANWTIVHCREGHLPDEQEDFEFEKLPTHCILGTWDVQFPAGIAVLPGEYVVDKRRYSAFFGTDLQLLLREKRIDQVVVVGVKTNVCVRATVQDAFGWGFRPVVVAEAVATNYAHLHEASLEDIRRYMGEVITLADLDKWTTQEKGEI